MATFSVNDQTRRIRAVVSSSEQQEFSVAFQSNQTTDIKVFVDGTQKTEGTHYDIKDTTGGSAVNGIAADGTCVVKFRHDSGAGIDHRPTQNQVVTIISDIALARTSVYTAGGNITAASLESDFDTVTMQMAEREEAASRALTAPKFDPTDIDMTLPDKDARKGKGLAFNATTGNPEATTFGDITSISAGNGIAGGGTTGAITIEIDSTVATLTGSQTLTNKTIDASQLVGTIADGRIPEAASDSAGLMPAADKAKLDGIEASATADQTASEIRALVESASDSNVFTDSDHSKLDGIETGATADQTASEIRALVESASDSNVFTDADHSKLDGIEASATADQTASEIRTLVESASDSNVFTDADHSKLNGIEASADVTDATNVAAAGALMDSEVTNLAQVKAFDSSDYATAAQGSTADAAMPKAGGTFSGDVTFSGATYNIVFDKSDNALEFADSAVAEFGNSGDLRIFHNGSHSVISEAGTGDLRILATNLNLNGDGSTGGVTVSDGRIDVRNGGTQSEVRLYCESSNAHYAGLKAPAHSEFSGDVTSTLPAATGILIGTANSDAPATTTSSSDADHVLVNDGGVLKKITPANLGIGGGGGGGGSFLPLSGGTLTGDLTLGGALVEEVYNLTGQVLDPSNGTLQYKILGGNTTFTETFSDGESITLMIDDGSAYTVTWPTMTWASGSAPTLATSGYTTVVLWHQGQLYGAVAS